MTVISTCAAKRLASGLWKALTRFIERRLKLQVNEEKSAVARPWERSFLGFTFKNELGSPRRIADKAVARFKHRIRELTTRHRGISLDQMIKELAPYLQGWGAYFGFSQSDELPTLDAWTRRRLRCYVWVQWKTDRRRFLELRRLGIPLSAAFSAIHSAKGPWRLSFSKALHRSFTIARFESLGLPSMGSLVKA
jgi:RNA-directed DNA polymerase